MRLLIFGSRGQLGRESTALCAANDVEMALAARSECDISIKAQVHALLRTSRATAVINAAAYTKVDKAEEESALAYLANRDGPRILSEACADEKVPLIHVSTDYVFDGTKSSPYRESDRVAPLNVYGSSKEAGEQAVRAALERHIIVRTAWVYGAHGNNFLKTMLNLAATRDTWGVIHDQIGTPTATIDLACALLAAARKSRATWRAVGNLSLRRSGRGDLVPVCRGNRCSAGSPYGTNADSEADILGRVSDAGAPAAWIANSSNWHSVCVPNRGEKERGPSSRPSWEIPE